MVLKTLSEFNEFKPCLKSPKNQFQLSATKTLQSLWNAGLNLEQINWNQQNLSRGLNLKRGSNSLNSTSGFLF